MDNSLLEKLETFYIRFREIGQLITDPEVIQDMKRYVRLTKEYKDLEEITAAGDQYKKALKMLEESKEILATEEDKELREMAEMEIADLTERLPQMEQDIKMLLIPADPEDSKNAILEIRGGTGGDEACLFAGDLFRMYAKFCEKKGWKLEVSSFNEGTAGGYKEIVASVSGNGVYGILKYESVCIAYNGSPKLRPRGGCIPRQLQWLYCLKRKNLMYRSMREKSNGILSAREVPGGRM